MFRNLILGIFVLIVLVIIGLFVLPKINSDTTPIEPVVTNFDECVDAGYPVQESYPPVCVTPGGASFTQEIGNGIEYIDLIRVANPMANQIISSPLEITGEARGTWYFEANFSAELIDANNKSLGVAVVEAQEDWMTEDFVPFVGTLTYQTPETKSGTLIVRNANASGLPENEKVVRIPVKFN